MGSSIHTHTHAQNIHSHTNTDTLHEPPQLSILLCQHEQHGVVEEAVDAYVITHALASTRLHHELARESTHLRVIVCVYVCVSVSVCVCVH